MPDFKISHGPEAPSALDAGKAMIYLIQDGGEFAAIISPVTHTAIDGNWVSGNKDNTYSAIQIEPGEHHLCVASNTFVENQTQLAHFTAEANKSYYFRVRFLGTKATPLYSESPLFMDLDPIDSDQGWYLVNMLRRSTLKPNK